jgi:hypothetical protein
MHLHLSKPDQRPWKLLPSLGVGRRISHLILLWTKLDNFSYIAIVSILYHFQQYFSYNVAGNFLIRCCHIRLKRCWSLLPCYVGGSCFLYLLMHTGAQHNFHIRWCSWSFNIPWRALLEQQLQTLPSLVFCVVFCRSLFVLFLACSAIGTDCWYIPSFMVINA